MGVVPLRFTEKQFAEYDRNPVFAIRSRCPAGVCLDIMTDAALLTLEVEILQWVRPYGYFDLYVDDRFVRSVGDHDADGRIRRYTFELLDSSIDSSSRMQRVTIYLPHNVELAIRDLLLSGGASLEAVPFRNSRNLLCLGDSITQGMDAVRPSHTYPVLLSRHLDMHLLNQGVGGYYYDDRSLDEELPYEPDLITIAYGTNDWGKHARVETFEASVATYLRKVAATHPDARIAVITPLWRRDADQAKPMGTFEQLTAAIASACRGIQSIRCLPGSELFAHDPALYADGVHPTDAGFQAMADAVAQRLQEV